MQSVMEASEAPAEYQELDGTWIQITFTLDPGQYRALRDRAEGEGLTVSRFVRQRVIDSLSKVKIISLKNMGL